MKLQSAVLQLAMLFLDHVLEDWQFCTLAVTSYPFFPDVVQLSDTLANSYPQLFSHIPPLLPGCSAAVRHSG
jgi:hypothetical protein